jgi:serine/threonine protein phosphatase PrpC
MRKRTYDAGRRGGKNNKNSKKEKKTSGSLKDVFTSTIYVKSSEGFSLAGKNDQGNKKTNQDTYVIERNVNGILNFNIFGVMDGHGDDGHFASQFVSRYVVHRIKTHPLIKKLDEPQEIYNALISNGYDIIANIYLDADIQIQKEKFDCTRSGTTIVLVIQLEEHIICANTGDSRAILIYDDNYDDNLVNSKIFLLSYDCKPELPEEKKRIYECGGVVEKAYYPDDEDDPIIPYRVWAKDEDYPGLAMSRSIGDMDAKKVGVIPNPQIVEYTIDYFSKYMLICSDGIWEFMKNEQAMKIGNKYYLRNDPVGLCHELTQESIKLWEKREVVIDDITVVVVFF